MHFLIQVDLSQADVTCFERYEAKVLPQLDHYGGRLEMRVRSVDGQHETHLIYFPDAAAREKFLSDPIREAARSDWESCGAVSTISEVAPIFPHD
jgi:uncharacterized protein (DUF1330 family)